MPLFAAGCELMSQLCPNPTGTTSLVFSRPSRSQTSAGEVVLSFASALTVAGLLDPLFGSYPRLLHGTLNEVNYEFYPVARVDLRVGDRTTISGAPVEVINVQTYPDHLEVALRYVR